MKFTLLAATISLALPLAPVQALESGQDFEAYSPGTPSVPLLSDQPEFGFISGGIVAAPGSTVDSWYALDGAHVYYGTAVTYTNIFPGPEHCCGYGRLEMLISSPNGVLVEFFGHDYLTEFSETLLYSEVITGQGILFGWGDPWIEGMPGINGDITTIRWTSLDQTPFAIDNLAGLGTSFIPEPASWAMMIAGFGLSGIALRRRRSNAGLATRA